MPSRSSSALSSNAKLGRNPYDVRKNTLGADPARSFEICVGLAGEPGVRTAGRQRTIAWRCCPLVYAGTADIVRDFIVSPPSWSWSVTHVGSTRSNSTRASREEFAAMDAAPWVTSESGVLTGNVRTGGGGTETTSNVTVINVHEAGRMVLYDPTPVW
ncbi:hypothetical protein FOMPIDRAFT_91475 [Fomitopsis schrenkii]|uniref:Uncharacterized protein n=1 Tax=Fomitopsis schrenkii TaxID=2126942 RepID=S8EW60_FOMSC|nr:hypothetical protein FOMPIDRAFT_91475 [Fomitopsis schrenkii]